MKKSTRSESDFVSYPVVLWRNDCLIIANDAFNCNLTLQPGCKEVDFSPGKYYFRLSGCRKACFSPGMPFSFRLGCREACISPGTPSIVEGAALQQRVHPVISADPQNIHEDNVKVLTLSSRHRNGRNSRKTVREDDVKVPTLSSRDGRSGTPCRSAPRHKKRRPRRAASTVL